MFVILVVALFEIVGLASIVPFIAVLSDPEIFENSSKINSEAYRNRLKTEYFNAHNIELSDVDLDNMIGISFV